LAPFDQKWQAAIRRFSFLVFPPRIIPSNERCEGCPNCLSWRCHHQASSCTSFSSLQLGAGPILESILPFMGFRQSCLERDPLRFSCNELWGVRDSHGPEEMRWWLVLDGNQDFGG
jgi:hypothetical protein